MPHALRFALLVCLWLPSAASAALHSYAFSGSIESVTDVDDFLDTSVAPTVLVSGIYEVDLATADGSSPFTVGPAQLSFGLGSYGFDATSDPHSITLINDTGPPGFAVDLWQSGALSMTDLLGGTYHSGNFAGYRARIEFFDGTGAKFDGSESAPFVPDDLPNWTEVRLILESLSDDGGGATSFDGRVQVQVNLTAIPEPHSAIGIAFGLASIALRRRSILRSR